MNEKQIKDYFENFEVPYQPEHWTLMQQRLEIEELAEYTKNKDDDFDRIISRELSDSEVPYNPAHWQLMEEKLAPQSWQGKIIRYKILEAAVILLLLWTSVSVFEMGGVRPQRDIVQSGLNKTQSTGPKSSNTEQPTHSTINSALQTEGRLYAAAKSTKTVSLPAKSTKAIAMTSYNSIKIPNIEVVTDGTAKDQNVTLAHHSVRSSIVMNKYLAPSIVVNKDQNKSFRIGVFGLTAIDQNVASSEMEELNTEENNSYGVVVGGGLSFGWRLKQFEIETGAAYNSISYKHDKNDLSNSLDLKNFTSTDRASQKYLRLPFTVKYLFKNNRSYKFYAVAGGNVHLHLNPQPDQALADGGQPDNGGKFSASLSSQEVLRPEENLLSRLYYSASIGLGFEKRLNDRASAFIQPEYYHRLYKPAVIQNKDAINAFAISVGVKAKL